MKNKFIRRMYVILMLTTVSVSIGLYIIFFSMTYSSIIHDIRERAAGVRDYILETLTTVDFEGMEDAGKRRELQAELDRLLGAGGLKRLYIAMEDETGALVTTLVTDGVAYVPQGEPARDLARSLDAGIAVAGSGLYHTDGGAVYSIYWPVMEDENTVIGAVGMEFDADGIYNSFRRTALYSLMLAASLISVFTLIAYVSMNRASEPFYKKLAYTDILTGLQNRMAYEQQLQSCEALIKEGVSVSLLMFDVNNLKTVNDTLGHEAGDKYIINTMQIITEHLSGFGELYRVGGDEFTAIVVDKDAAEIDGLLKILRKEERPVLRNHRFSCASGAATFTPGVDNSLKDMIQRADDEMYGEKRRQKEALARQ